MNVPVLALLVLALAQSDTTALVEAAKDAKAKRQAPKGTRKVITNADLAKSKGKVIQRKPEDLAPLPPVESLIEKYEAERKAKAILDEKLTALDATIAGLENELAAIEQRYYEANDLEFRDKHLVAKFNEVKANLEKARAERDGVVQASGLPPGGENQGRPEARTTPPNE